MWFSQHNSGGHYFQPGLLICNCEFFTKHRTWNDTGDQILKGIESINFLGLNSLHAIRLPKSNRRLNNFMDQFRISCFRTTTKQVTISRDQGKTFTKKEIP